MTKNNVNIVAIAIVMELIMVAAAVRVDISNANSGNKVVDKPNKWFDPMCMAKCSVACLGKSGWWKAVCLAGCALQCAGSEANGPALQCTQNCATTICSQYMDNPDDEDKLEKCITDQCLDKCLPSH